MNPGDGRLPAPFRGVILSSIQDVEVLSPLAHDPIGMEFVRNRVGQIPLILAYHEHISPDRGSPLQRPKKSSFKASHVRHPPPSFIRSQSPPGRAVKSNGVTIQRRRGIARDLKKGQKHEGRFISVFGTATHEARKGNTVTVTGAGR